MGLTFHDIIYHKADGVARGAGDQIRSMVSPNYFRTGEQQEGAAAFLAHRAPDFSLWR